MDSPGERLFVILLTLITLSSVVALTYLLFAATPVSAPAEAQLQR